MFMGVSRGNVLGGGGGGGGGEQNEISSVFRHLKLSPPSPRAC